MLLAYHTELRGIEANKQKQKKNEKENSKQTEKKFEKKTQLNTTERSKGMG